VQAEFTEEQVLLRDSAQTFLRKWRDRSTGAAGQATDLWNQCAELGWLGLPLDEAAGGSQCGPTEIGILMHAFGQHALVTPYRTTILYAACTVATLGSAHQRQTWLPPVLAGKHRMSFAHDEPGNADPWAARQTTARQEGTGWVLQGTKPLCAGGRDAAGWVISATQLGPPNQAEPATLWFLVPSEQLIACLQPVARLDDAQAADLHLDHLFVPSECLLGGTSATSQKSQAPSVAPTLARVIAQAQIAACWEACGNLDASLQLTLTHVQQRSQFNQPLSDFQAVQHRLAEMALHQQKAHAACRLADWHCQTYTPDGDSRGLCDATRLARIVVSDAARYVSQQALQLHGAMGMTEECRISHHFRRLTAFQLDGPAVDEQARHRGLGLATHCDWQISVGLRQLDAAREHVDATTHALRTEIRAFLHNHLDADLRRAQQTLTAIYPDPAISARWQAALAARGWLVPLWPPIWGGTGWTGLQRFIFEMECAAAGAPLVHPMGVRLVGPLILRFGSEAQKAHYLPRIISGQDYWCQGFSEAGAGSDLARLTTRAQRVVGETGEGDEGDHYIVNGHKLWTTHAQHASHMFALLRTHDGDKPSQGLSFFLIDLRTPGIHVRPIATMDGNADVNEVIFENVRLPADQLVGGENQGWACARYLLEFERGAGIFSGRLRAQLKRAVLAAHELADRGEIAPPSTALEIRCGTLLSALDTFEMLELQSLTPLAPATASQSRPGPRASMLKLLASRLRQDIAELGIALLGSAALRAHQAVFTREASEVLFPDYLASRAHTIFGGAAEIQLGLIARDLLHN